jgi:exodeoxyribonuclease VII small subunit
MTLNDSPKPAFPEINALSFEAALRELETIVRRMESGESLLEQSINDYARGMALKAHCEAKLNDARMQVEKVVQGEAGQKTTVPFDPES